VLKCPLAHVPAAKPGGIVAIRIKEAALGLHPNRLETSTVALKEPRNRTFTKARVLCMFSGFGGWQMEHVVLVNEASQPGDSQSPALF
jgi:hypothetical protein